MSTAEAIPDVLSLRFFLHATDFEASLRFYVDLGFEPTRLGDALASMQLGPFSFSCRLTTQRVLLSTS